MIHYGECKTELPLVLRGTHRSEAMDMLKQFEIGTGVNLAVHSPLGQGKQLRVVRGYKHVGAIIIG